MSDVKISTKSRKVVWLGVLLAIAGVAAVFFLMRETPEVSRAEPSQEVETAILPQPVQPARRFKVLHVMSYHSPWKWTDDQFRGFKDALRGLDVQYEVFQMDTKRQSSEQWKLKVGVQAKEVVEAWKPDLVFTGDDNAQQYFAKHYVNTDIHFVFCAVNAEPEKYGFAGSKNVTGVLERVHFMQTVRLLKQMVPTIRKIAIVTDTGKMWVPMMERLKRSESKLPQGIEVESYYVLKTFEEYKKTVKDCEGKVDALGLLGVFEFKDENGANVTLEQVERWTVENSSLPDFAFWKDRVDKGTLCAVTVSGFAQGQEAGKIARGILVEGRSPSSYPIRTTEKGIPIVNLARAKKLNLKPESSVLLTAEVVTKFPW